MKKLVLVALSTVMMGGFGFAQSTGTVSNINTLSLTNITDSLAANKNSLFSGLDIKRIDVLNRLKNAQLTYSGDVDYSILNGLGSISYSNIESSLLDDYISLKTNILNDFNTLNSQISILNEKSSLGILTNDSFNTQKNQLSLDVSGFNSKYLVMLDLFTANGSGKVTEFQKTINTLKVEKKDLLSSLKQKVLQVNNLTGAYANFNTYLTRINSIYIGNYDDIKTFISQLKDAASSSLRSSFNSSLQSYYSKYPKLYMFSGDISAYADSTILAVNNEIDTYFNQIFSGFYNQSDIDFINTNMKSFSSKYLSSGLDYKLLSSGTDFSDTYDRVYQKLLTVNSNMDSGIKSFNSAEDIQTFKTALKQKIESFYNSNKDTKVGLFNTFVDKQIELLKFKLNDETTSYNNLLQTITAVKSFTGTQTDKYYQLKNIQSAILALNSKIISDDIKSAFTKNKWEIEVSVIDNQIIIENISKYELSYPQIDATLKTILGKISSQFALQNKTESFNQKLEESISKIDTMITSNTSAKTKFLLLKIKKAMINTRYLS